MINWTPIYSKVNLIKNLKTLIEKKFENIDWKKNLKLDLFWYHDIKKQQYIRDQICIIQIYQSFLNNGNLFLLVFIQINLNDIWMHFENYFSNYVIRMRGEHDIKEK
jgi:hypothetical protein